MRFWTRILLLTLTALLPLSGYATGNQEQQPEQRFAVKASAREVQRSDSGRYTASATVLYQAGKDTGSARFVVKSTQGICTTPGQLFADGFEEP